MAMDRSCFQALLGPLEAIMGREMHKRQQSADDSLQSGAGGAVTSGGDLLEPGHVAQQVVEALAEERFLILTHKETQKYAEGRIANVDKWIAGMQTFAAKNPV